MLFIDLSYSISIFVCRLVVTENIWGGQLPPLPAPGYHHSAYDIFSAQLPVNTDYVNANTKNYHTHMQLLCSPSLQCIGLTSTKVQPKIIKSIHHEI